MSEPLLMRSSLLGITVEATKGTHDAPAAAATLEIYDLSAKLVEPMSNKRMPDGAHPGNYDAVPGAQVAEFSFRTAWRYGDDTVSLLKAAGYWEYDSGGNPRRYRPTLDLAQHKTLSLRAWQNGVAKPAAGCVVTSAKLSASKGGLLMWTWTLQGKPIFTDTTKWPIAEAMPSQAPYNGSHYVNRGATLTLASFVPRIDNIDIDLGVTGELRDDVTDASGNLHGTITGHEPSLNIGPEATLPTDNDAYSLMLAGTTFAFTYTVSDGSNSLTVYAPRTQRMNVEESARGKRRVYGLPCSFNASSGSDNLEFRLPA